MGFSEQSARPPRPVDGAALKAELERGYTLPWQWYTDPGVLRLEQERIFGRAWQYAGHVGQVARAGDHFACRAGSIPVVVVRDERGELKAFLNVCRHRGAVLVEGSGRRRTLQCGYHGWTYGLDGSLRAAPRSGDEPRFDPHEFPLLRLAVDTWGPFVFVSADPAAAPLASTLGALPRLLEDGGIDLAALKFRLRAESELAANWKIACENFLECYHCPVAHPGFSAVVDVDAESYALESYPTFASQRGRVRPELRQKPYDPIGTVEAGQFHLVFPNVKLNVMPGHPNLSIGAVLPVAPERSVAFLDYFFAEDLDEEWIRDLLAFDEQVGSEDKALVESVQQGVRAGLLEHGRLLMGSEHLIAAFQRYVLDALSDEAPGPRSWAGSATR